MEDAKGAINRSRRAGALTSNAHADSNGSGVTNGNGGVTNGNGGVTNGNGILNGYDEHDSINFEADTSIYNAALDAEHVLDSMLDAFIEVDSDGVILLWNGKAEEMFGWSRSEVVGCYVQDMIVPERYRELYNNQVLVEAIKMAYKGTGEVAERNIILKKRDGTEIPVLSRAYAYKDGNTIRIGGSVRDTSTLRTMEERLASAYLRDQLTFRIQFDNTADRLRHYFTKKIVTFYYSLTLINMPHGHDSYQLAGDVTELSPACQFVVA